METIFTRGITLGRKAMIGGCIAIAAFALTGCRTEQPPAGDVAAQTPTPTTPTPAPTPAPSPAPAPTPSVPSPTLAGLASIASNFDINSELVPSWGTGAIPASAAPDVVGAFRFICNASHVSYNDPIVYPGQPGKSHLHQFFGNSSTDANSTYASLRTTGQSTCNSPVNRSAYWMPAMMNGKGKVVVPDYVTVYYKREPANSAACQPGGRSLGGCVDLPRGLRFIFGYDMLTGQAPTGNLWFNCDGATAVAGHYHNIVEAAKNCPVGNKLGAVIQAPQCWDGKNLDSANHRDHVAYAADGGYGKCPDSHPYLIPAFTLGAWYTTDADLDRSGVWDGTLNSWHLSSDEMAMPMMPGSTFHTDWFGAWDDEVMKMWMDNCINKLLNCSGGDLGNGKQMKMFAGSSWTASPHTIDAPPKP
jgi:hypothetical protein